MVKVLIPLLVAQQTTDGILTYSAVGKDIVKEGNPLMETMAGTEGFLIMKILGAIFCALLLWLVYKKFPRVSLLVTSSIVIIYTMVLSWNFAILLKI